MFTSLANQVKQTSRNAPVAVARSLSSNDSASQQSDAVVGFQNSDSQPESQQQGQDDTNYDDYIVNNHNREAFIEPDSQFVDFEDSPQPSSCSDGNYPVVTTEEPTQLVEEEQPTQIATQVVEEPTQPTSSPNILPAHLPVSKCGFHSNIFLIILLLATDAEHCHHKHF